MIFCVSFNMKKILITAFLIWISKASFSQQAFQKVFDSPDIIGIVDQFQSADSSYLMAGYSSYQANGSTYGTLVKTDKYGDTVWTRKYGYWGYLCELTGIVQTADGGYIVTGDYNGDILLLKIDSGGNLNWARTYGDTLNDAGYIIKL